MDIIVAPICVSQEKIHYQIELFQQINIECNVRSDPKDVVFFWEFNSSYSFNGSNEINVNGNDNNNNNKLMNNNEKNGQHKPLMKIENEADSSVLRFTPRSIHDYGTLYCFAQNRIGRQEKPCIFHISKSGNEFEKKINYFPFNK